MDIIPTTLPPGPFRGFGVCQSEFALEAMINLLAEKVGISPWEIRFRNAIEPGKVLPNGQIADCSTALKETLLAVKEVYEANRSHAGIACAMKNSGVGVGLPDKGRARLVIEDGQCVIYCAASDIGQGCLTVFCQDVAEATGLPLSKIRNGCGSTEIAPDSGTTSGSRQTLLSGEAVRGAAQQLKEAMDEEGISPAAGPCDLSPSRAGNSSMNILNPRINSALTCRTPRAISPMAMRPMWRSWTTTGK